MTNHEPLTQDERILRALHFLVHGVEAPSIEARSAEALGVAEPDDEEPPNVDLIAELDVRGHLPRP
ncbi:MAG TPA: hypothetical protein VK745_27640 [Polyangiaceae bacterium]|nr:hypothetical protein [Polyangiaceae bacterium]